MIGPSLVGWLGQPPEQAARLARWAEDLGAQPLLRDDALGLWLRPGGAARPLRWAGLAGAYVGRLYGVEDGASPRTIAEAQSGGRLQGLDGRFCAVLWDGGRHRLSLYRDPSSALPLYYRAAGPGAVFADDLDALAASPGSRGALDPDALHEYLRFLDIASPSTVYAGIRSPEPGVELVLAPGAEPRSVPGPAPRSAPARAPDTGDLGRAADRVEQLFDAAVARRLPPQGPVVAFLSGGVDSALIAASCARLAPGRTVAFTVGFEEHGFDETPAAAAIAAHLGLPHRVLRLPLAAYRPAFDELAGLAAYPFADPTAVPTLLAFRQARTMAPVALDGTGAEACVGTMPGRHSRLAARIAAPLPRGLRRAAAGALRHLGPIARYAPLLELDDPEELLMRWRGWTGQEIESLCGVRPRLERTRFYRTYRRFPPGRHFERYTALLAVMPDDRIHEIGRLTDLEVRFPFFDPALAAYLDSLPIGLRHPPGEAKRILREVLARRVPSGLWDLPKHGFDFPFAELLALDNRALIRDYLDPKRIAESGLMDPPRVAETVARLQAGEHRLAFRVWGLAVLFAWLARHRRPLLAALPGPAAD